MPPELQKQVSDFVSFLRKQQQKQSIKKRTVGEYKDKIVLHDDFDEPLADDFWLGEKRISCWILMLFYGLETRPKKSLKKYWRRITT